MVLTGAGLASFALFNLSGFGHLGVGWSLLDYNLPGGLLRMMFSFSVGLLMSRLFKPVHIRGAFWWCSLGVAILLCVPHLGTGGAWWHNGLYDSLCVLFAFPLLVWLGASGQTTDHASTRVCKFFGRYFLSALYHPLSLYVFVLCLGVAQRTFFLSGVAGGDSCIFRQYSAGLSLSEAVR